MIHHLLQENSKDFLSILAIDQKKGISCCWPQSDGEVARLNKTLLKAIRIAELQSNESKKELRDFLFPVPQHFPTHTPKERQILLKERYARKS